MVAVTIVALMLMLSLPSMSAYFQNAKIGSAAQTFASGLQSARTEAIRRNDASKVALVHLVKQTLSTLQH